MQTLRELIERYADGDPEFLYYVNIIEKAENNEVTNPDIAIECCSSLLQGISKTIVFRLNPPSDKKAFENQPVQFQLKAAFACLTERDDVIELEFARRAHSLAQVLGELRNARGDISHGRAVPKELESDRSLSRLAMNVSEAIARYMLASFFANRPSGLAVVAYEKNKAFNEFLDQRFPLEGKPLYSLALFQQFYEDYLIQLEMFEAGEQEGVVEE